MYNLVCLHSIQGFLFACGEVEYTESNIFLFIHWTEYNTAQLLVSMCQTCNTVFFLYLAVAQYKDVYKQKT